ncbi:MAG: DUF2723 domain-containing protein [Nitrospirae bacterium]|nr:DUF2723 domain-containing protein [Nitrospirota bacterium]MBI5696455.1 DUF2723 domain-containing protein [Nitrospirota bacterium]
MKSGTVPSAGCASTAQPAASFDLAGALVFLLGFAVYLVTLAPTITFWDSGELVMGAVSLGNPHPPAYPIFCMLGKVSSLLPFGSLAYRVNLLSAVFGAGTAWLLFRLVREMGGPGAGPVLTAGALSLAFGLMPSFWGVSVVTEVYTINAFLLAASMYLLMRHARGGDEAYLHSSAFTVGLALVNHQSVVLFLPAYAAYYLSSGRIFARPGLILQSAFFFALGYSSVLYLPLRAAAGPAINIGDPDTLGNFVWMVKWQDNMKAARGVFAGASRLLDGGMLPLAVLAALACLAALYLVSRKDRFIALCIASSLLYFSGITALSWGADAVKKWGLHEKFYIPAFLFMVPAAAWAVFRVTSPAQGRRGGGLTTVAGALLMLAPAVLLARGYHGADNSRNYFAYDFASDTLKSVPQDAALFGWGDNGVFPVWYLQGAERYRDDVFYMHSELLTYGWYMDGVRAGIREKYGADYTPRHRVTLLEKNVPALWETLRAKTPTYLDFSAVCQLKVPWEEVLPQGMVYTRPGPVDEPQSEIWDRISARAARDTGANRAFAVEGVMDIYGFQCYRWGADACYSGLLEDSDKAFALCEALAPGMYTSRCSGKGKIEDLRKEGVK